MAILPPHTPPKHSGERHIPLPDVDSPSSPHHTISTSAILMSWSPPFTVQQYSSYHEQVPPCSPLVSLAELRSLPSWPNSPPPNDGAAIHAFLHSTQTILDLASPQFMLSYTYNSEHTFAPATNPPVAMLTLKSMRLPFVISIMPTTALFVTVRDVLWGLYTTLRQALSPEHQKLVPQYLRPGVTQACRDRGGKSLLQVDVLLGVTKFIGLSRLDDGCWEIMVK